MFILMSQSTQWDGDYCFRFEFTMPNILFMNSSIDRIQIHGCMFCTKCKHLSVRWENVQIFCNLPFSAIQIEPGWESCFDIWNTLISLNYMLLHKSGYVCISNKCSVAPKYYTVYSPAWFMFIVLFCGFNFDKSH